MKKKVWYKSSPKVNAFEIIRRSNLVLTGDSGEDSLFVKRLRNRGLKDAQIAMVLDVLDSVCLECLNWPKPCYCKKAF